MCAKIDKSKKSALSVRNHNHSVQSFFSDSARTIWKCDDTYPHTRRHIPHEVIRVLNNGVCRGADFIWWAMIFHTKRSSRKRKEKYSCVRTKIRSPFSFFFSLRFLPCVCTHKPLGAIPRMFALGEKYIVETTYKLVSCPTIAIESTKNSMITTYTGESRFLFCWRIIT